MTLPSADPDGTEFRLASLIEANPAIEDDPALLAKVTAIAAIPKQMDRYEKDGIEIIKLYSGLSPHAAGFVVKEAHLRDILVIADFWRMNMDRIIMEATGLDGWAHGSPSEVPDSSNKWMAENDRFCIVTATLGEAMSALRVKDEGGKKSMLKEPLIVDVWGEGDDPATAAPGVLDGPVGQTVSQLF